MNEECLLAAALSAVPRLGTRRLSAMLAVQSPSKAMEMLGREAPGAQEIAAMKQKLEDGEMSVSYIGAHDFPALLVDDVARPSVLFYRGDLYVLQQRRVGIVGTRSDRKSTRLNSSH